MRLKDFMMLEHTLLSHPYAEIPEIDEIRESAQSYLNSNDDNMFWCYETLKTQIRLCDALEFVMAIARDECESPYFDEIAKILEGK